jgi:membrane protease YdiL (CAAX protease family)
VKRFAFYLFLYESLLGGVGALIAWLLGYWPSPLTWYNKNSCLIVILGALPMIAFAFIATHKAITSQGPFKKIFEFFQRSEMGTFIRAASPIEFAGLSACAGFVEEFLFRGVLQPHLGLWLTSIFFGAMHALTLGYFVIATVISLYLGWIYETSEHMILVPMLIHAVYDFVALCLYQNRLRHALISSDSP